MFYEQRDKNSREFEANKTKTNWKPREKKLFKQLFNSIFEAQQIQSNRIESDNKTQRVSATNNNNNHRGVPLPLPLSPYTALSAVSDVGVALGMQIMSNVTTNSTQDAAATRLRQRGNDSGHKNFLLLLYMRRQEEREGETSYLPSDLRH